MSSAVDIYSRLPRDPDREHPVIERAADLGGRLDSIQITATIGVAEPVRMIFEFPELAGAERFADAARGLGEHVKRSYEYIESL